VSEQALRGERVLVVGGSSGIGEAVAAAARDAGAAVIVASRRPSRCRVDGAQLIELDVTDDDAVERAFALVGAIDHLVCTAASGFPRDLLSSPEQTRLLMESKLWGQYRCARAAAERLAERGSITLTSGIRSRRPLKGSGAFTVVNMAVEGMARALALELAPRRVNVIAPGTVETPVFDALPPEVRQRRLEAAAAQTTVGRIGTSEEIAQAALMCMTNSFLSGAVLDIDGGGMLAQ
jgi:NAD(P)-dependent dehydrogenase (short-subunit alcohol dehydrogenase family)